MMILIKENIKFNEKIMKDTSNYISKPLSCGVLGSSSCLFCFF